MTTCEGNVAISKTSSKGLPGAVVRNLTASKYKRLNFDRTYIRKRLFITEQNRTEQNKAVQQPHGFATKNLFYRAKPQTKGHHRPVASLAHQPLHTLNQPIHRKRLANIIVNAQHFGVRLVASAFVGGDHDDALLLFAHAF